MSRITQVVVLGSVFGASAWVGHLLFGEEIAPTPAGPPPVGALLGGRTGAPPAPGPGPGPVPPSLPAASSSDVGDTDDAPGGPPLPEGPVLITFEDISDWELDPLDVQVPASVRRYDGRTVDIVGYMIPYGDPDNVEEFLIVRDLGSCCFGAAPQPHHLVEARMVKGKKATYAPGPVRVRGTFRVEEHREGKFLVSVFALDATECVEVR